MSLSSPNSIRVLIADDSLFIREILREILQSAPSLEVCGMAQNGVEVLEKVRELQPDVITLDIEMPLLSGIEVLKKIMEDSPRPVIIISSHARHGADTTLEALSLGAFDCLSKFEAGRPLNAHRFRDELISKIEAAGHAASHRAKRLMERHPPLARQADNQPALVPEIVAIGTSTGGPRALQEIIPEFPPDLPVPVIIVQHMPIGFTGPLAKRLDLISEIEVREAEHGDSLDPCTVYIAPAGRQITLQHPAHSRITIALSDGFPGILHKPSVDLMMLSVAAVYGRSSSGIILTGMGCDGLQGMTAIHRAGGITIGQDEASCTVYGMPRACAERGVLQRVVSMSEMPKEILRVLNYKGGKRLVHGTRGHSTAELHRIGR